MTPDFRTAYSFFFTRTIKLRKVDHKKLLKACQEKQNIFNGMFKTDQSRERGLNLENKLHGIRANFFANFSQRFNIEKLIPRSHKMY